MGLSDVKYCGKMRVFERLMFFWILYGDKVFLFSYFVRFDLVICLLFCILFCIIYVVIVLCFDFYIFCIVIRFIGFLDEYRMLLFSFRFDFIY